MQINPPKKQDMTLVIVNYPIGGNCSVIGPTDTSTVYKLVDLMKMIGHENYFVAKIHSVNEFFKLVPTAFGVDENANNNPT